MCKVPEAYGWEDVGDDEPTLEKLFGFYDAVYPFYDQVRIVPQLHKIIRAK